MSLLEDLEAKMREAKSLEEWVPLEDPDKILSLIAALRKGEAWLKAGDLIPKNPQLTSHDAEKMRIAANRINETRESFRSALRDLGVG